MKYGGVDGSPRLNQAVSSEPDLVTFLEVALSPQVRSLLPAGASACLLSLLPLLPAHMRAGCLIASGAEGVGCQQATRSQ
jgi:hypothetical protein